MFNCIYKLENKINLKPDKHFIHFGNILSGCIDSWSNGMEGQGMIVAIIDNGIKQHKDFKHRIVDDFNLTEEIELDNNHGTHVAGIIAANGSMKGIMPMSSIANYKIISNTGGTMNDLLKALNRAELKNVHLINMSLGTSNLTESDHKILQSKFESLYDKGIICVAASGNDGISQCTEDPFQYPASLNYVISVNSCSINDKYQIKFSKFSNENNAVEFIGIGDSVLSTVGTNGYGILSGTSMAAPHVTGVLGLIYQKYLSRGFPKNRKTIDLVISEAKNETKKLYDCNDLKIPNQTYGFGFIRFSKKIIEPKGKIIYNKDKIVGYGTKIKY